MPMYEYKCANCGKVFELIQRFSDAPLTVHEECGSGPVERLISRSALVFKGSGWYVNDYAKSNGAPAESKSKSEGEKSDGGKSEGAKSEAAKSDSTASPKSESSSSKPESSAPAPAASTDK